MILFATKVVFLPSHLNNTFYESKNSKRVINYKHRGCFTE